MKKTGVRKLLAALLALVMCFSMLPASAFAEEPAAGVKNDIGLEGTTSLGNLIAHTVENADGDGSMPGGVTDVAVSGNLATVEFYADRDAEVVVAVYPDSETDIQMLGSGHARVPAGEELAQVELAIDPMPNFFVVAAYLLDAETMEPLSEQYISRLYTEEVQNLQASDITDYDPDRVINLDNNPNTNFMVLGEDVLSATAAESANQVTDNGDGTYTVYNADESFRAMQPGDSFTYEYEDGTLLVVVVQSVSVDGTTVYITEDPDADLSDVFDFVKIEASEEEPQIYADTDTVGDGVRLLSDEEYASMALVDLDTGISGAVKAAVDVQLPFNVTIKGTVAFTVGIELKVYVTLRYQYISLKLSDTLSAEIEISGEMPEEVLLPIVKLICPIITGVNVEMTPSVVLEASASIVFSAELSACTGFAYDSETGWTNLSTPTTLDGSITVEGELFIGVSLDPSLTIITKKLASAGLEGKFGVQIKAVEELTGNSEVNHPCDCCLAGVINAKLAVYAKTEFLNGKAHFTKTFAEITIKIKDFYLRLSPEFEFGWGKCPRIEYPVKVIVQDADGNPVENAIVDDPYMANCKRTDADGIAKLYLANGEYEITAEKEGLTARAKVTVHDGGKTVTMKLEPKKTYHLLVNILDTNGDPAEGATVNITALGISNLADQYGQVGLWLENGTYEITAEKDGLSATGTVTIRDSANEITLTLRENGGSGGTGGQGSCGANGDNVTWVLSGGVLTISGTGAMCDYAQSWDAPWTAQKNSIHTIIVEDGVTGIGRNAFYGCVNLTSVTIANSVTDIGFAAFKGCSRLTSATSPCWPYFENCPVTAITVPAGATEVRDSAFSNSFSTVESVSIPDTVTSIGKFAFQGLSRLKSITLPSGLTSIGNGAFDSTGLESIVLPGSVAYIGFSAFAGSALQSITIPAGVTKIEYSAFSSCSSLVSVSVAENNSNYSSDANGLLYNKNKTSLLYVPGKAVNVVIPGSVTSIGDSAFFNHQELTDVTIPVSVTRIGEYAFDLCSNLANVYYAGTSSQWELISISKGNDRLQNVTIHYGASGTGSGDVVTAGLPADDEPAEIPDVPDVPEAPEMPDVPETPEVPEEAEEPETTDEAADQEEPLVADSLAAWTADSDTGSVASFSGLVPNMPYVVLITADSAEPVSLAPDNLLYIGQANSDGNGSLAMTYALREGVSGGTARAFGPAGSSLKDAEIEIEQFVGGKYRVTVTSAGAVLTEDTDYVLTVSEDDENNTVTVTVRGRDRYYGYKTVTADKYPEDGGVSITLTQNYLALKAGEERTLQAEIAPAVYEPYLRWYVVENLTGAVTLDGATGTVTAEQPGTALVRGGVETEGRVFYTELCRIDVAPAAGEGEDAHFAGNVLTGVRLADGKATVELYSTKYTRIRVIPELAQNQIYAAAAAPAVVLPESESDSGAAVESAKFADPAAAKYFGLRVADDRALEIVPDLETIMNDAAAMKALKGGFRTAVTVTVDGQEITTEEILTLTVKQTLPKLKAKAVKLNSFIRDEADLRNYITGAAIRKITVDVSKENCDWVMLDGKKLVYTGEQNKKQSGKLYLNVEPEGWAVSIPVTLSVSAAKTAPKMSLKPGTLSLQPGVQDTATAALAVDLDALPGARLQVVSITEGKNSRSSALNVKLGDGTITVREGADAPTDGKAHSYKVTVGVMRRGVLGSSKTLTVKLLAANTVRLTAGAKGGIDTAVQNSPVTLTGTLKNIARTLPDEAWSVSIVPNKALPEGVTADSLFDVSGGNPAVITAAEGGRDTLAALVAQKYSFTAVMSADVGAAAPVTAKAVKLSVKASGTAPKLTVSLKAGGSVDVIRKGSAVTLTPTVKNCYTWNIADAENTILTFYRKDGKSYQELTEESSIPFDIQTGENGFRITLKEGASVNPASDKYYVKLTVKDPADAGRSDTTKAYTAVSVKMGAAKLTQSTKTVVLLKTDGNSSGAVSIGSGDAGLNGVSRVVFADSMTEVSKDGRFTVENLGGDCIVRYTGGEIPVNLKPAKLKLAVFLEGNDGAKANASLPITVKME